jgi:hypothetical protein
MELVNRKSDKSLISIIRQTGLLAMLIFFLSALANPISVLAEETSQAGSTFLQDKLNQAREYGISGSYKLTDELIAQADSGEYYDEAQELKSKLSGAGGYYGDKDWQAFVAIYLWFVGMNGETGQGEFVADVDVGFGDIWNNLDFGIQGHVELWWKKLIFFVDPIYMKISSSNKNTRVIGSLRSDLEVKMFLMDMAAGYRVAEIALGSGTKSNNFKTRPSLAIDLYGGGRLVSLDTKLDLTLETPIGVRGQRIKLSETWFDFIVGSRLMFNFTENLLLSVKSDIGGFGLGFSSNIDWNFAANVGYQLPWWGVTPYLGYRVLYLDYEDGSGSDKFVYKVWNTGPQIGVGVKF